MPTYCAARHCGPPMCAPLAQPCAHYPGRLPCLRVDMPACPAHLGPTPRYTMQNLAEPNLKINLPPAGGKPPASAQLREDVGILITGCQVSCTSPPPARLASPQRAAPRFTLGRWCWCCCSGGLSTATRAWPDAGPITCAHACLAFDASMWHTAHLHDNMSVDASPAAPSSHVRPAATRMSRDSCCTHTRALVVCCCSRARRAPTLAPAATPTRPTAPSAMPSRRSCASTLRRAAPARRCPISEDHKARLVCMRDAWPGGAGMAYGVLHALHASHACRQACRQGSRGYGDVGSCSYNPCRAMQGARVRACMRARCHARPLPLAACTC